MTEDDARRATEALLADVTDKADSGGNITGKLAQALLRAAYGQGYMDALAADNPNHEQAMITGETLRLRVPVI